MLLLHTANTSSNKTVLEPFKTPSNTLQPQGLSSPAIADGQVPLSSGLRESQVPSDSDRRCGHEYGKQQKGNVTEQRALEHEPGTSLPSPHSCVYRSDPAREHI